MDSKTVKAAIQEFLLPTLEKCRATYGDKETEAASFAVNMRQIASQIDDAGVRVMIAEQAFNVIRLLDCNPAKTTKAMLEIWDAVSAFKVDLAAREGIGTDEARNAIAKASGGKTLSLSERFERVWRILRS